MTSCQVDMGGKWEVKYIMAKIRKAVIPAAGFGTRFLPQTKAMPKEMLPVVDKPVIQYVVEEVVASGIEDEPFSVIWGDEFIYSTPPRLKQMIDVHEKYGGIVISGVRIEKKEDLKRYGIADVEPVEGNVFKIKS